MPDLSKSRGLYLDVDLAKKTLADALYEGCLVLYIGAGVSQSATNEFPDWISLANNCCANKNIDFDIAIAKDNNGYVLDKLERVQSACKHSGRSFSDLVAENLYKKGDGTVIEYGLKLMSTDLLVALGALVISSVRGNAGAVVNYNFDDVLEWYLGTLGYKIKIFSDFPDMNVNADVTIYHPHGFLPKLQKHERYRNPKIVFSKKDYQQANYKMTPWNEIQQNLMNCNVGLHIGLSGDDQHIDSLCLKVYEEHLEQNRIIAFSILRDTQYNKDKIEHNLERGIVSIFVREYEDIPNLLLEICQMASNL